MNKKGFLCSIGSMKFRVALALICFVALVCANFAVSSASSVKDPKTKAATRNNAPTSAVPPLLGALSSSQAGESSKDGLWRKISEESLTPGQREREVGLAFHIAARLDRDALTALLRQAPLEFSESAKTTQLVLTLPMPDGTFSGFAVEESPVMEPGLASQFPEIKTYRGQGIDDPTATARFDWMPSGLHAIILSSQGTSFVEPFSEDDSTNYIAYFNHDVSTENLSLSCLLSQSEIDEFEAREGKAKTSQLTNFVTGTSLRTYRLAVAATAEFTTQYGGGSVATTLTKITTLVNQINAVYQKEATITFQLVANETSIIFTDPATDGYTNSSPSTMLAENQTKLDAVIGSANYDVGHVFGGIAVGAGSISFSGVAQIGVVCSSGSKGKGVSTMGGASSSFPHSIFVSGTTHELAHQFSAPHTFNSTTGGCSGQRSGSGAYEPGSGSTIMGYSICGADNLQTLPDLYFHTGSLENIVNYATSSGTCATSTSTGQHAPTIPTLSNFSIPANTPFTLTGSATDPDGDALTYEWEEFDLGAASPPNTDDGTRPLFRSFPPSTNSSRTFPSLQYILNNANVPPSSYTCGSSSCFTGQVLPSTTRTMNFRFTARDNRAAGGGTANAGLQLSVLSTAGPFVVTQPNTAVSWAGGTSQTVTWNVAGTTAAPINAANVKISLSTDGGTTFPTVLAASTANDGSETVTIPNTPTTTARIKVEAVGNVFFDISNTNFTITSGGGGISVTVQTSPAGRSFTVDGTPFTTAQTFSWTSGSSHTISTTTPQSGATGTRYVWANWSDGGAISHTVAPTSATTFTANFTTQFFLTMTAGAGGTVTPASNWFDSGQSVGITAIPNGGFTFTGWAGVGSISFTGTTNPASVTMNGPITETASFNSSTGANKAPFDFDGDGRTDTSVWRSSTGVWFILKSSNSSTSTVGWGVAGDQIVPGDYDGDGKADVAVWRPSTGVWFIVNSSNSSVRTVGWGVAGDTPVPGDYDGDGQTDIAIWRPSTGQWFILNSSNSSQTTMTWGVTGDIPVPGDYDADGLTDLAVWRPSNGTWYIVWSSNSSTHVVGWGVSGDKVVQADYDGDGRTDVAVWRPSTGVWFILNSSDSSIRTQGWGLTGDTPVPGDYDGDSKSDLAIWRPSSGNWIIINSTTSAVTTLSWGVSGDTPVPSAFVKP